METTRHAGKSTCKIVHCISFAFIRRSFVVQRKSLTSALLVATGGVDGSVRVCNVGSLVKSSSSSSPSSTTVDGSNASNTLDAAAIQTMTGHADRVYGVDFHPRAPLLASASADGTVRLWASTASTSPR
jgi:WD40 repeat protein